MYIYSIIQYILCVCAESLTPPASAPCFPSWLFMPRHMAPQVPWLLDRPPAGGSPCLPRPWRCRSIRGPSDRSSPGWGPPHLEGRWGWGTKNPMVILRDGNPKKRSKSWTPGSFFAEKASKQPTNILEICVCLFGGHYTLCQWLICVYLVCPLGW